MNFRAQFQAAERTIGGLLGGPAILRHLNSVLDENTREYTSTPVDDQLNYALFSEYDEIEINGSDILTGDRRVKILKTEEGLTSMPTDNDLIFDGIDATVAPVFRIIKVAPLSVNGIYISWLCQLRGGAA